MFLSPETNPDVKAYMLATEHAKAIGGHVRVMLGEGPWYVGYAVFAGQFYADGRNVCNDSGYNTVMRTHGIEPVAEYPHPFINM